MANAPRPSRNRRRRDPQGIQTLPLAVGTMATLVDDDPPFNVWIQYNTPVTADENLGIHLDGGPHATNVEQVDQFTVRAACGGTPAGGEVVDVDPIGTPMLWGPNINGGTSRLYLQPA